MASKGKVEGLKWEALKNMPTKRVFSFPIIVDDKLYVIGGCDQMGTPLDCLEMYDMKKGKWFNYPAMPTKRAGVTAVAVGKKIYVCSGVTVNQEPLDDFEEFDTESKSWKTLEKMGEKLLGVSSCEKDGKVYLVGGMGLDTNPRDSFMCYDIEKNIWKKLLEMPTARYASGAFLVNDKFYVLGGRHGKTPVTAAEYYDFETSEWHKLEDIPTKRVFPMYLATSTHLYSIGGLNQDPKLGFSNACETLDYDTGKWTIGTPIPTNRGDAAIGLLGNKVIVAGGLGNTGRPLATVESYDVSSNNWEQLPDLPSTHCSCAFLTYNKQLYVIGGLTLQQPQNRMAPSNSIDRLGNI